MMTANLPPPGRLGRAIRAAAGLISLALFGWLAASFRPGQPLAALNPLIWLASAHSAHYLPYTAAVPYGRERSARVWLWALPGLALAAGFDWLNQGAPWGAALALAWNLLAGYSTLVTGASYLLASALAVPG